MLDPKRLTEMTPLISLCRSLPLDYRSFFVNVANVKSVVCCAIDVAMV